MPALIAPVVMPNSQVGFMSSPQIVSATTPTILSNLTTLATTSTAGIPNTGSVRSRFKTVNG